MRKVVLDSNIWDKLHADEQAMSRVKGMVASLELQVIVPASLARQLEASPFGMPNWFPTVLVPDSVMIVGFTPLGTGRLGHGGLYTAHRGDSNQVADAVIVDAANTDADLFVSDDRRARTRYAKLIAPDRSLNFAQFRSQVLGLID